MNLIVLLSILYTWISKKELDQEEDNFVFLYGSRFTTNF